MTTDPNIVGGLIGGLFIGCGAVLLLLFNGRVAGISGILGGLITPGAGKERGWRAAALLGLVCGAAVYSLSGRGLPVELQAGTPVLILAGLLVGSGTRLGSGCTSGHGVCGLARRSPRSLAATLVFIGVAMLTVYLTRHVFQ